MSLFSANDKIFTKRRERLVQQLREKGIQDERVLSAVGRVPRHAFIDSALHHRAYEDSPLPILQRQTISQPFTVARQSELLHVKSGEKVLEIGTGSGYQAAVLCELGAEVYSVERHRDLYEHTRELFRKLDYRAQFKCGDGTQGWSAYAPYDAIVVTAGAPIVPDALKDQLNLGGRLVIPVGDESKQLMLRLTRNAEQQWNTEEFSNFKFVPLIGKDGW